ncbi:MAG: carbonic anhydrase [Sulfuritalea sp.]|nr:carbonic anhydrase [Sulfuritalea sp.]
MLGPSILGTLQYAALHLHTPLFVVMGHEGCGAVKAAVAARFDGTRQGGRIEILLEQIIPALDALDPKASPADLLSSAVEANVRRTVRELLETPEAKARLGEGHMRLIGAVYELDTGRVRF